MTADTGLRPADEPVVIEPASVDQAALLLELQVLCYQGEAQRYDDFSIPPLTQSLDSLKEDLVRGPFLVARSRGGLVGSVRARLEGEVCRIGKLLVHPSRRRQGLGTRLMTAIEALAGSATQLEVFTGHRSEEFLRLYERCGYQRFKTLPVNDRLQLVFLGKRT